MSQLIGYLESIHVQGGTATSRFFEYMLGEENGKDISLVDGFFSLMSAAGLSIIWSNPKLGLPLFITGTSTMTYRRGPQAGVIVPLAAVTAAKRPDLVIGMIREGTETLGEAARGAVQLGFQVTGLIVTTAGAVAGYVFSKASEKKNTINKIE